jgi:hypothetical protein
MGLALGPTRRSLMFTTVPERMTRFAGRPSRSRLFGDGDQPPPSPRTLSL